MKNILLIGGTKFVGRAILEKLLKENYKITIYHRGNNALPFSHPNMIEEFGNCQDPLRYKALFKENDFSLVIHTVAYEQEDIIALFPYLKESKIPILVIGTGQVYIVTTNKKVPYKESDYNGHLMPAPQVESDFKQWIYGVQKRDVEEILIDWWNNYQIPSVTLRCPVLHGKYDYSYRLFSYVQRVLDGGPIILPFKGNSTISHLYVEDLAEAVFKIISQDINSKSAYNLSMNEKFSLAHLIHEIGNILRVPIQVYNTTNGNKHNYIYKDCSPFSGNWVSVLDAAEFKLKFSWEPTNFKEWLNKVVLQQAATFKTEFLKNYKNRALEIKIFKKNFDLFEKIYE